MQKVRETYADQLGDLINLDFAPKGAQADRGSGRRAAARPRRNKGLFDPLTTRRSGAVARIFPRRAGSLRPSWREIHRSSRAALTVVALGVVYGDIGTSPLCVKETFAPGTASRSTSTTCSAGCRRFLGADRRRFAQVRGARDARRQPRRGRHGRSSRSRAPRCASVRSGGFSSSAWDCSAHRFLRRGGAHARDLGCFRGRRPGGRHQRFKPWVLPLAALVLVALSCSSDRERRS